MIDDFCQEFEPLWKRQLLTLGQKKRWRRSTLSLSELMPRCAAPLAALFELLKGRCTGLSILDSTPLAVCDNLRIRRHRVFRGLAARGKSSTGWFYGFKLHFTINHCGELLSIKLTPGNVDDRKPVPSLVGRHETVLCIGGRRHR